MINIRASPRQKERKRELPLINSVKKAPFPTKQSGWSEEGDFRKKRTNQNRKLLPSWWKVLVSIWLLSLITKIVFNELWIVPIMMIAVGFTYLLIQVGNNLQERKIISFFLALQNKKFAASLSILGTNKDEKSVGAKHHRLLNKRKGQNQL